LGSSLRRERTLNGSAKRSSARSFTGEMKKKMNSGFKTTPFCSF